MSENNAVAARLTPTGEIRRVDDLGRVVIPKNLRERAGIEAGTALEEFEIAGGVALLRYDPSGAYVLTAEERQPESGAAAALRALDAIERVVDANENTILRGDLRVIRESVDDLRATLSAYVETRET